MEIWHQVTEADRYSISFADRECAGIKNIRIHPADYAEDKTEVLHRKELGILLPASLREYRIRCHFRAI